jgi:outer membrane protein assembly factor BamB
MRPRPIVVLIVASMLLVLGCQSATPSPSSPVQSAAGLPPLVDVPFYRADTAARGIHPGPGPAAEPELAWRATVGEMHMVPILVDGLLIVGTNDERLVALGAHTGKQRWTYQANDAIKPSLAAADGLVYASDGAALHAVEVATGAKRWSTAIEDPVGRVNVVGGVAYVGTIAGVVGFDAKTGKEIWRWDGGPYDIPVGAGPMVGGVGYFATRDARVFAVDVHSGDVRWTLQTISHDVASGQVVGDTFYVSTNQGDAAEPAGEIYAIDRASGKVRWRFRAPSGLQLKEGPVKDGVLYANGRQDGIWALRDEGSKVSVVWHVDASESHWPMALAGDTLYVARTDGSVGTYATADGKLLWETEPEGAWSGGPIVSGGMVFVANDTHGVIAFADPSLIALLPKPVAQGSGTIAPSGDLTGQLPNPFTIVRSFSWADTGIDTPLAIDPGPDGLLYVFDVKPQVTVIDPRDGRVVRRWGRQGAGKGEFDVRRPDDNPGNGGISVGPDGRVYVADGSNHRVQGFEPDGTFLFQFGSFGSGDGQFQAIVGIQVANDGSVYTIEEGPDRQISKFSAGGKFVWRSPDPASNAELKKFIFGFSVRADGSLIASCEACRYFLILDPEDAHVSERLEAPTFGGPVSLDPSGNIYVAQFEPQAELVFDPKGRLLGGDYLEPTELGTAINKRITWGDTFWPSPVFLPDGRGFTFGRDGMLELKVTLP